MTLSIYDISVPSYQQVLGGLANVLAKGAEHAAANGIDTATLVQSRLHEDMLALDFQVWSASHHSLGAVRGMLSGEFRPPPKLPELDYAGLQQVIADARSGLEEVSSEDLNARAGEPLVFKLSGMEIPFTVENFLLSFSLPNFYFHAATAYDLLRQAGVPLGKMDYLGQLRSS